MGIEWDAFDAELFEQELDETLRKNREAFNGKYKDQLNGLAGLSNTEIDSVTPGSIDLQIYDELITVVKEASRVNLEQVQLKQQIKKLGEVAIKIAEKVPSLAVIIA